MALRVRNPYRRELTYRQVFGYARRPGYVRNPKGIRAMFRDLIDSTPGLRQHVSFWTGKTSREHRREGIYYAPGKPK